MNIDLDDALLHRLEALARREGKDVAVLLEEVVAAGLVTRREADGDEDSSVTR